MIGIVVCPAYAAYNYWYAPVNPQVVAKRTLNVAIFIDSAAGMGQLNLAIAGSDTIAFASRPNYFLTLFQLKLEQDYNDHFKVGANAVPRDTYLGTAICHELWHLITQQGDDAHSPAASNVIDSSTIHPGSVFSGTARAAIIAAMGF
jgi:hypothetical protein